MTNQQGGQFIFWPTMFNSVYIKRHCTIELPFDCQISGLFEICVLSFFAICMLIIFLLIQLFGLSAARV